MPWNGMLVGTRTSGDTLGEKKAVLSRFTHILVVQRCRPTPIPSRTKQTWPKMIQELEKVIDSCMNITNNENGDGRSETIRQGPQTERRRRGLATETASQKENHNMIPTHKQSDTKRGANTLKNAFNTRASSHTKRSR